MPLLTKPLLFSAVLLLPQLALAGGIAEIESGEGDDRVRATLQFDGTLLRMQTAVPKAGAEGQGEMIFRDGKVYAVVSNGGTPMVMEMGGMMKMMGNMAKQQGLSADTYQDVNRYYGLQATGKAETVGGVRGEVYRLDYENGQGQRESKEVVLSSHVAARDMAESMMAFGSVMAESASVIEPEGSKQLQAELTRKKLGVLRFGQEFRVLSLSSKTPPASSFVLPAAPMQMPDLSGFGSLGAGVEGTAETGGVLGGIFGQKVDRQKGRVESRAEGEADAATDRAVDKVLDKAFGKIFGN